MKLQDRIKNLKTKEEWTLTAFWLNGDFSGFSNFEFSAVGDDSTEYIVKGIRDTEKPRFSIVRESGEIIYL